MVPFLFRSTGLVLDPQYYNDNKALPSLSPIRFAHCCLLVPLRKPSIAIYPYWNSTAKGARPVVQSPTMSVIQGCEATQLLKRELRKRIRAALAALPPSAIEAESKELANRFLRSQVYQNAASIALFASMPQELNTENILSQAFRDSKRVFLPRVVSKQDHRMLMLECSSMAELLSWTPNSWNIREPPLEEGRAQSPRDVPLDIVLVPGLAFDARGARCGQGMGYYDRFLSSYAISAHPMPHLVSLALSVQIVDSVPVSESDWRIDEVLHWKMQ